MPKVVIVPTGTANIASVVAAFRRLGADPRISESAADVAKAGYAGMLAGKTVVVPSWSDRVTTIAPRFVPRALVPRLIRRMQEPSR